MNNKMLHMVAFILLIVGGLNWGLIGLLSLNVVDMVLGSWPVLEQILYVLVGLSAVLLLITHKTSCKYCGTKGK